MHKTIESLLECFQSQKGVLEQVGAVIGPGTIVTQQIACNGNAITDVHH